MQPRDLDHELPPVTRLRERQMADVELDIEIRILDPIRSIHAARHRHQSLAKQFVRIEAAAEVLENILEADLAARRR